MLTKLIKQRLEIPHEPGEWIEVRMLSAKKKREAREARTQVVLANARAMGAEVFQALQDRPSEVNPEADPLDAYDRTVLLRAAILGWSYDERVTADSVLELDERTEDWLLRAVLKLGEDAAGERKNA